ncbi:MAG TPA: ribosomal protein L15 family protein, partial [Pelagibacterales bacterium]|nr:ribosomal protein L15 family protein [Pelagibacterales bacterium]
DVGELSYPIIIEVSYASKKAIKKVEKIGGKVNLIKVL